MLGLPAQALDEFAAGALLVVLGALIKFRGWTFLVAGYDRTSPVPDEVVAEMVGSTVLRVGLAVFALGAIVVLTDPPAYLSTVFAVAILLAVARLLYRLHTYPSDATA